MGADEQNERRGLIVDRVRMPPIRRARIDRSIAGPKRRGPQSGGPRYPLLGEKPLKNLHKSLTLPKCARALHADAVQVYLTGPSED